MVSPLPYLLLHYRDLQRDGSLAFTLLLTTHQTKLEKMYWKMSMTPLSSWWTEQSWWQLLWIYGTFYLKTPSCLITMRHQRHGHRGWSLCLFTYVFCH